MKVLVLLKKHNLQLSLSSLIAVFKFLLGLIKTTAT